MIIRSKVFQIIALIFIFNVVLKNAAQAQITFINADNKSYHHCNIKEDISPANIGGEPWLIYNGSCYGTQRSYTDEIDTLCANNIIINRTWHYTDTCGSHVTTPQRIVLYDDTAPSINSSWRAPDIRIPLDENCEAETSLSEIGFLGFNFGDCSEVSSATYKDKLLTDDSTTNCAQKEILRKWVVSDECGNTSNYDQSIFLYTEEDQCETRLFKESLDNGKVKLKYITQGEAPYEVKWNGVPGPDSIIIDNSGIVFLTIEDSNGCLSKTSLWLDFYSSSCSSTPETTITRDNRSTIASGVARLVVRASGDESKLYKWSHLDKPTTETSVIVHEPGNYCVETFFESGCSSMACYELTSNDLIVDQLSCNLFLSKEAQDDGRFKLDFESDGQGPLNAIWESEGVVSGKSLITLESGIHCVTVIDANQCVSKSCIEIEQEYSCKGWTPEISTKSGADQFEHIIEVQSPPFEHPDTLVWHDTGGVQYGIQAPFTAKVTKPGRYCIKSEYINGCKFDTCFNIYPLPPISEGDVYTCGNGTVVVRKAQDINEVYIRWFSEPTGDAQNEISGIRGDDGISVRVNNSGTFYAESVDRASGLTSRTRTPVTVIYDHPTLEVIDTLCNGRTWDLIIKTNATEIRPSEGDVESLGDSIYKIKGVDVYNDFSFSVYSATGCSEWGGYFQNYQCFNEYCETEISASTLEYGIVELSIANIPRVAPYQTWSDSTIFLDKKKAYVFEPGEYCVTTTNVVGCESSDCITVEIDSVIIPPPFSEKYEHNVCVNTRPEFNVHLPKHFWEVDWFDSETGGSLILTNSTKYTPLIPGEYYAEYRNSNTGEKSIGRRKFSFIGKQLSTFEFDRYECSEDGSTFDFYFNTNAQAGGNLYSDDAWRRLNLGDNNFGITNNTFTEDKNLVLFSPDWCIDTAVISSPMVCSNFCPLELILDTLTDGEIKISIVSDVAPAQDILWSDGSSENYIIAGSTGEYCVTVVNTSGCESQVCVDLFIPRSECDFQFEYKGTFIQYYWKLGADLDPDIVEHFDWGSHGNTSSINVNLPGKYCLTITTKDGCVAQKCKTMTAEDFAPIDNGCYLRPTVSVENGIVSLSANVVSDIVYAVSWSTSESTEEITITSPGEYCVQSYTNAYCSYRTCITVDSSYFDNTTIESDTCDVILEMTELDENQIKISYVTSSEQDYAVSWSNDLFVVNQDLIVDESGEYCITITDNNGCISSDCINVVIEEATPTCTTSLSQEEQENESIKVIISTDAEAPYSIDLNSGTQIGEGFFYVDESGEYCVTITDRNGCVSSDCINVIIEETTPTCTTSLSQEDQENERVKVIISTDAAAPYTVNLNSNIQIEEPFFYVDQSGEYCITITDNNGCVTSDCINIVIEEEVPICSTTLTSEIVDNNQIRINYETEGTAPFTINWPDNGTNDGDNFIVNQSGSYCITITDSRGCISEDCVIVNVPCDINVGVFHSEYPDPITGAFRIEGWSSGVAPFTYEWENGDTSKYTIPDQDRNYCVTITDANGCVNEACNFIEIEEVLHPDSCTVSINQSYLNNGRIRLSASTSRSGSQYIWIYSEWSRRTTDSYIEVNRSGDYCVKVIDVLGCESQACISIVVEDDCDPRVYLDKLIDPATGRVSIEADGGGVYPFKYEWSLPTSDNEYLSVTEEGTYCVTITDGAGCVAQDCIYIDDVPSVSDSCRFDFDFYVYDPNPNDGEITISADPNYSLTTNWDVQWEGISASRNQWSIDVSSTGQYCATIIDGNGCKAYKCIDVDEVPPVSDSCDVYIELYLYEEWDINGNVKYMLNMDADFYSSEVEIIWSNGDTLNTYNSEINASGEYCVTVTTKLGCSLTACLDVILPDNPISCFTGIGIQEKLDGTTSLRAHSVGVYPFTYNWYSLDSSNINTENISNPVISAEIGNYCVQVTDATGCSSTHCIELGLSEEPEQDSCSLTLITTPINEEFLTQVIATPSGLAPYSFTWSDGSSGNAIEVYKTKSVCVSVEDANGCKVTKCAYVQVAERPCSLEIKQNIDSTETKVTLEAIVEGHSNIQYLWNNGNSNDILEVTESGEYCITINTASGCNITECIQVEIDIPICDAEIEINPISTEYRITLDAMSVGEGPFTYEWDDGSKLAELSTTDSGTYCVTVTDVQGCQSEDCIDIEVAIPVCNSGVFINEIMDSTLSIGVEVDGQGPYTYFWSTGDSTDIIEVQESREYCVEVIDALGCITMSCLYVDFADYFECGVTIDLQTASDSTMLSVLAIAEGSAPFTYRWEHGDSSRYFIPESDGNYCVTVVDVNGCIAENCIEVILPETGISLDAFPSPTEGNFEITIDSELEFTGRVEIRDVDGNLIFTEPVNVEVGQQSMEFSSDNYPSGVFFVSIIGGSTIETIRVIKI